MQAIAEHRTLSSAGFQLFSKSRSRPRDKSDKPQEKPQPFVIDEALKITVIHEGPNPKRMGAAKRFAIYKSGMKVSTYINRVGDRRVALADLRWDITRGFIKLGPDGE